MKKLVVCGCSWSSRDRHQPGVEFGQFIADHYSWNYVNTAVVSASNFIIRLQIQHAIENESPDLFIINWTNPARIEWNFAGKEYNPLQGLKQVSYTTSTQSPDDELHPAGELVDPTIAFNTFQSLFCEDLQLSFTEVCETYPVMASTCTEQNWNALRHYYTNLYDTALECHKQIYIMQSAIQELQRHNIPFLMSPNTLDFLHDLQTLRGETDPQKILKDSYYPLWDMIPEESKIDGVASMLSEVDSKLYDTYDKNPGRFLSSHISPLAHKAYAERLIPSINNLIV